MSESPKEMMGRVRAMAAGGETWDLSDNDLAALRHVLKMHDAHKAVAGDYRDDLIACGEAAGLRHAETPTEIVKAIGRLQRLLPALLAVAEAAQLVVRDRCCDPCATAELTAVLAELSKEMGQ